MKKLTKQIIIGVSALIIVTASGFTYANHQTTKSQFNSAYQEIYTKFDENKLVLEDLTFLTGKDEAQKVYDQYLELQSRYFFDTQTLEANSMSLVDVTALQEEVNIFFDETNTLMTTKADEKVKASLKARDEVKVHEHANETEKTNFSNAKKTKTTELETLSMSDKIKTIKSLQSETATLHEQYKTVQARVEAEARAVAEAEAYAYAQSQAQANSYSNNYNSGGSYNNNYNSGGSSSGGNNNYTPAPAPTPAPPTNNDWNTPPCGGYNPGLSNKDQCYESF